MANKLITCEHCKAEHKLENILQERSVNSNLIEVGLQCTCGIWTHSYFTSPTLKQRVIKLGERIAIFQKKQTESAWQQYKTMQDAYKVEFDAFNHRWRRKLKMLEGKDYG